MHAVGRLLSEKRTTVYTTTIAPEYMFAAGESRYLHARLASADSGFGCLESLLAIYIQYFIVGHVTSYEQLTNGCAY
jgi:hypothetical protein